MIPREVFAALKRGGDISHFPNKDGVQWSYRSQWYFDAADNSMRALGVHGQSIYINIDNGVLIVSQSSWPSASYPGASIRRYYFLTGISTALGTVK